MQANPFGQSIFGAGILAQRRNQIAKFMLSNSYKVKNAI